MIAGSRQVAFTTNGVTGRAARDVVDSFSRAGVCVWEERID